MLGWIQVHIVEEDKREGGLKIQAYWLQIENNNNNNNNNNNSDNNDNDKNTAKQINEKKHLHFLPYAKAY